MRTEIGHFAITYNDEDYELIPSFKNIRQICDPSEMPAFFATMFGHDLNKQLDNKATGNKNIDKLAEKLIYRKLGEIYEKAALVIQCCCDKDTSKLTGFASYSNGRRAWRSGAMHHENLIHIARAMLIHGVIGTVTDENKSERNETVDSIDVYKYVEFAVTDLEMSYERAEQLTKTEFDRFFDSKHPEVKKKKQNKVTLDDHKANIEILKEINKRREAAKAVK